MEKSAKYRTVLDKWNSIPPARWLPLNWAVPAQLLNNGDLFTPPKKRVIVKQYYFWIHLVCHSNKIYLFRDFCFTRIFLRIEQSLVFCCLRVNKFSRQLQSWFIYYSAVTGPELSDSTAGNSNGNICPTKIRKIYQNKSSLEKDIFQSRHASKIGKGTRID